MGYTHYWRQSKPATDEQWAAICTDFNKLRAISLLKKPFPIQRECDEPAYPEVNDKHIIFNGVGHAGHETMYFQKDAIGFNFCKTNGKPYDFVVMVLLALAHHHAPGVWDISSDGEPDKWEPALDWMNSTGIGTFELPPGVISFEDA